VTLAPRERRRLLREARLLDELLALVLSRRPGRAWPETYST
jgi:hypothetical protein